LAKFLFPSLQNTSYVFANPLFALAALGKMTLIEMILFLLHHPRWMSPVAVANSFANKLYQCEQASKSNVDWQSF
jgi:hypothetical protein